MCTNMFRYSYILTCFILGSVYANSKDADSKTTTTQKTPKLEKRFFGLENIFGQIFHGSNYPAAGGFGGAQLFPGYQNPQYPQQQFNNWQNVQTPNQAQSNLDGYLQSSTPYPQGGFNSQNNFGPSNLNIQSPQQFPNQQDFNQQSADQYPSQSMTQGSNPGNNFGQTQNFNPGTLDGIPPQSGTNQGNQLNQPAGSRNQIGFGNQMGNQNGANQLGSQNPNGLGFQNQGPQNTADYNPVAILGKPVPMTTSIPDSIVFQDGCDTPTQRQCVQDCQSSTEYRPLCGSNNVTYFNPGRFICARNCGINVFIQRSGRCDT